MPRNLFIPKKLSWECDCDSPSALQRWLRKKSNREKVFVNFFYKNKKRVQVLDLENIVCKLPLHGNVRIIDTLPLSNNTLCDEETEVRFVSGFMF